MAQYKVTGPDNQEYIVTAPEGASREEIMARVQKAAAQEPEHSTMQIVDDFMRSVADGATFGYSDEIAAGLSSLTGIGSQGDGTYEGNLKAERERDANIPLATRLPGQLTGGLMTAGGLMRGGLTLARPGMSTAGKIGAGAGEGAAYGAA